MTAVSQISMSTDGTLGRQSLTDFERDGFLVLEDFATGEETAALRAETARLIDAFDPASVKTVFSTANRSHAADIYFRESGDKIRFFLEDGALNDDGVLTREKTGVVNKIGHALHDLNPAFEAFSRSEKLANLSRSLGLIDPAPIQSMLIFKQPEIGGEVGMHQDATFLYTEPVSVVGFWLALEDADLTNGCLVATPGGHKGPLRERFRYFDADTLGIERLGGEPLSGLPTVPLEVKEGTLVVLHGLLPHGSAPNTSPRSRMAYTLHVIDRKADWPADNWLKRAPELPLRGFDGL